MLRMFPTAALLLALCPINLSAQEDSGQLPNEAKDEAAKQIWENYGELRKQSDRYAVVVHVKSQDQHPKHSRFKQTADDDWYAVVADQKQRLMRHDLIGRHRIIPDQDPPKLFGVSVIATPDRFVSWRKPWQVSTTARSNEPDRDLGWTFGSTSSLFDPWSLPLVAVSGFAGKSHYPGELRSDLIIKDRTPDRVLKSDDEAILEYSSARTFSYVPAHQSKVFSQFRFQRVDGQWLATETSLYQLGPQGDRLPMYDYQTTWGKTADSRWLPVQMKLVQVTGNLLDPSRLRSSDIQFTWLQLNSFPENAFDDQASLSRENLRQLILDNPVDYEQTLAPKK